jgi:ureidoacrylate peracid hydrolase
VTADPKLLAQQVDPTRTALIIVDVQNDFAHLDGKAAKWGGDMTQVAKVVAKINRLIEAARSNDVAIIYARIEHSPSTDRPNYRARYETRGMHPSDLLCATGTWGAEFYGDLLLPRPEDAVITKYGYDAFQDTALDAILHSRGVENLVITGLVTNLCVQTTAEHGFGLGYFITIVSDATAGDDELSHLAALRNLSQYFGLLATGDEIISLWQKTAASVP